jgi:hypothetical protein
LDKCDPNKQDLIAYLDVIDNELHLPMINALEQLQFNNKTLRAVPAGFTDSRYNNYRGGPISYKQIGASIETFNKTHNPYYVLDQGSFNTDYNEMSGNSSVNSSIGKQRTSENGSVWKQDFIPLSVGTSSKQIKRKLPNSISTIQLQPESKNIKEQNESEEEEPAVLTIQEEPCSSVNPGLDSPFVRFRHSLDKCLKDDVLKFSLLVQIFGVIFRFVLSRQPVEFELD